MTTTDQPIGLVLGLAAEVYHSDPDSVSNTMLSAMNKSPAHCWALHLAPERPANESTPAQAAGTLAHAVILEPKTVAERFAVKPPGTNYRTNAGKAWHDAQTLPIVALEDLERANDQQAAFLKVTALASLLRSGEAETSVFWRDKATGLRCRARPDWLHWTGPKRVTPLDVKTISDLTPKAVQRAIATYGYHRQAAHYCNGLRACGLEVDDFVFGFVSSSYPFLAVAYVLDDETMQQGKDEVGELLDRYANCQRLNEWPAFGDGLQLTGLPTWAKRSSEVEVEWAA